ncbi:MAG: hypothetical protein NVS9B1_20350 [Candidatus Dormibacteraceae bacterium]
MSFYSYALPDNPQFGYRLCPQHNVQCPGSVYVSPVGFGIPTCSSTYGVGMPGCPMPSSVACRLPIVAGPGGGGFLTFPGGHYDSDPASNVTLPGSQAGANGYSYDVALSRWLPVPRALVAPDGRSYVYQRDDGIHVQDLTSGANRLVPLTGKWRPLDYEPEGIYAVPAGEAPGGAGPGPGPGPTPVAGLWLLSSADGSSKQVAATGYWSVASGGVAYGLAAPSYPQNVDWQVVRLDISSQSVRPWFAAPNAYVIGIDSRGAAIIQTQNGVRRVAEANRDQRIATTGFYVNSIVSDRWGTWLSSGNGIYLLTDQGQLLFASNAVGNLAGACVK